MYVYVCVRVLTSCTYSMVEVCGAVVQYMMHISHFTLHLAIHLPLHLDPSPVPSAALYNLC